jgi:hypothetical protein
MIGDRARGIECGNCGALLAPRARAHLPRLGTRSWPPLTPDTAEPAAEDDSLICLLAPRASRRPASRPLWRGVRVGSQACWVY